jgi:Flp pilus assembly pilin Flp
MNQQVRAAVARFVREDSGQGNTEYIILIGVLALGAIAAVIYFRNAIMDGFRRAADWLRSSF